MFGPTPHSLTELTEEELGEALRVDRSDAAYIGDLYSAATAAVAVRDLLRSRLDGKAASQLAASGLSVSATLVIVGGTAGRGAGAWQTAVVVFAGIAVVFGIASTVLAARAMAVEDYKIPSIAALFGARQRELVADLENHESAHSEWRLSAILHLLRTAQLNDRLYAPRAHALARAQLAYQAFLVLFAISISIMVLATATGP